MADYALFPAEFSVLPLFQLVSVATYCTLDVGLLTDIAISSVFIVAVYDSMIVTIP